MSYRDGATPLATLCQKAGSTLDEVLALDEEELEELSKEIVGNGVLEHARVIRQWRRCRLEEAFRKELEVELANEGEDTPETYVEDQDTLERQEEAQDDMQNDIRRKQEQVIGESWQQYLRKQIRVEMEEIKPPPVSSVIAATRSTASAFTEDDSDDDYETFGSVTLDPSLESVEDDTEVKTGYNPLNAVGSVASDMMGFLEDGITAFLEPELPRKNKKKKPPKSFLESGLNYFYPEPEPERKNKSRKKEKEQSKSILEDALGFFSNEQDINKENKKKKSTKMTSKKQTRNKSSGLKKGREQNEQEQRVQQVPTRSLQLHASQFRC